VRAGIFFDKEIEAIQEGVGYLLLDLSIQFEQRTAIHHEKTAMDHHGHTQGAFGQSAIGCIGIQFFKLAAALRANLLPISIFRPAH
jgi:hypothetical protein